MAKKTMLTRVKDLIGAARSKEAADAQTAQEQYVSLLTAAASDKPASDRDVEELRTLMSKLHKSADRVDTDLTIIKRDLELQTVESGTDAAVTEIRAAQKAVVAEIEAINKAIDRSLKTRRVLGDKLMAARKHCGEIDEAKRERARLHYKHRALIGGPAQLTLPASIIPDGLPAIPKLTPVRPMQHRIESGEDEAAERPPVKVIRGAGNIH